MNSFTDPLAILRSVYAPGKTEDMGAPISTMTMAFKPMAA